MQRWNNNLIKELSSGNMNRLPDRDKQTFSAAFV